MLPILYSGHYFTLHSYPLFLGFALGVSYYLSSFLLFKKESQASLLLLWWPAVLFAWVGAKILFVLTYHGEGAGAQLLTYSSFWFGGGFVFLGGLIGALLYFVIGIYRKLFNVSDIALLLPGIAFGHAVGRVGCFMAGCCYGLPHEGALSIYLHDHWRYPVQLYESFSLLLLGGVLLRIVWKKESYTFYTFITYLGGYSVIRFFLEFLRGDKVRGFIFSLSTSQFLSLIIFSAVVITIIWKWIASKRR